MPPYREGPVHRKGNESSPETGLVDEMVRQFADPYAFLRELVQNGIDAGATRLLVSLSEDGGGVVRTSVDDDGKGMTRAIIEGPLLTLFQSSKEDDSTKIGKYGVGFMSVFATKPTVVEVRTRTKGEAWLVRLFPDHSYELSSDDDRVISETGTIVTLVHSMDGEAFVEHAKRSTEALTRWCRHAHLPISLDGRTINEPFDVKGVVTADAKLDGGRTRVSVGAGHPPGIDPSFPRNFIGYYNRGLTLYEAHIHDDGTAGVRVKIDSPELAHTLSRDNVRRDAAMERVLARAVEVVRGPLWENLAKKITEVARDVAASSGAESGPLLAALYDAATADAFGRDGISDLEELLVPLVETIDGALVTKLGRVVEASEGVIVTAELSTPLTRALAERGVPVVKLAAVGVALRTLTGAHASVDAASRYAFASSEGVTAQPGDDALLDELWRLAGATGRAVSRVCLAQFVGAATGSRYRLVETEAKDALISVATPKKKKWSRGMTLFLDSEDPVVRLARRRAKSDPRIAAHLLFRAVLLDDGPIAPKDVDRLVATVMEKT